MAERDFLEEIRKAKKNENKQEANVQDTSFDMLEYLRRNSAQRKLSKITSELSMLDNKRSKLYENAQSRFYDAYGDYSYVYRGDASDVLETFGDERNQLNARVDNILNTLSTYENYYDAEYVKEIRDYLEGYNTSLDEMYKVYQYDADLFADYADEESFNRAYDNSTYGNKYAGKTYSNIQGAKHLTESLLKLDDAGIDPALLGETMETAYNALSIITGNPTHNYSFTTDSLERELYWLENHETDKQFVDTMSIEELEALEKEYQEAKKNANLNDIGKDFLEIEDIYNYETSNPGSGINEEKIAALCEKYGVKVGDNAAASDRIGDLYKVVKAKYDDLKAKYGSENRILYYDEEYDEETGELIGTGDAITTSMIIDMRECEALMDKINSNPEAKSAYDSAFQARNDNMYLEGQIKAAEGEMSAAQSSGNNDAYNTAYNKKVALEAQKFENDRIIEEFTNMGYDLDRLINYHDWNLSREKYIAEMVENQAFAKDHPALATLKSIVTAPFTVIEAGADAFRYMGDDTSLINIYDNHFTNANQVYQSTVTGMINEATYNKVFELTGNETVAGVASWMTSGAYSGITSSAQSYLTTKACMLMFGPVAGPKVALAIMGTEAASSAYTEAVMNGSTNGEALLTATAAGISEALFEEISLEKIINIEAKLDVSSLSAYFKSALKNSGKVFVQGLFEGSEEVLTEISNEIADRLINGDHSSYYIAIDKYKKMGYREDDAIELANKDFLNEVITALYGGIIGGDFSGIAANAANIAPAAINSYVTNQRFNRQGQSIVDMGNVNSLLDEASGGSRKLRHLANSIHNVNTDELDAKGMKRYAHDVGKLYKGVRQAQSKDLLNAKGEVTNKVKDIIRNEVKSAGVENVDKAVDILVKKMSGKAFDNPRADSEYFASIKGEEIISKVQESEEYKAAAEEFNVSEKNKKASDTIKLAKEMSPEKLKSTIIDKSGYKIGSEKGIIDATDEVIDTYRINSLDGDDISLTVKTGDKEQNVLVHELKLDEESAFIFGAIKDIKDEIGLDVDAANSLLGMWSAYNGNAATFYQAAKLGIMYGQYNQKKFWENSSFKDDLPEGIFNGLYEIGRKQKQRDAEKGDEEIKERTIPNGEVKVTFAKGVEYKKLTKSQKAQVDLAQIIARAFGFNLEIFRSPKLNGKSVGENGSWQTNGNLMRLDIDAGTLDGKSLILFTQAHELTHYIKAWNKTGYQKFADFLLEKYAEKDVPVNVLVQRKINASEVAYAKELIALEEGKIDKIRHNVLTREEAYDEVVCNACEDFLKDPNIQQTILEIAKIDQGIAQKIKSFLRKLINRLEKALAGLRGQSEEAGHVRGFSADELQELKNRWLEALIDARENMLQARERFAGPINYEQFDGAKNENGDELFQYRAIQHDVPEYRALLEKYSDMSSEQIDSLFETMNKAFAIIEDNLEILDYAWDENLNEDGTWDDSVDARAFNPVKPNSDKLYKYSLDFSTLCRKRLLQQVIAEELSLALDRAVTKAEGIAIRNELIKLQEEGRQIEIACALCYVESARMKSPEQIQKFIDNAGQLTREFFASKAKDGVAVAEERARKAVAKKYAKEIEEGAVSPTETTTTKKGKVKYVSLKKLSQKMADEIRLAKREARASYTPSTEEQRIIDIASNLPTTAFTTAEGLKNLAKDNPDIFDAYTSFVRNATHSKGTEKDVWYRVGDADKIGNDLIAAMNKENGLRSQSWSDFQVIHLLDYVGAIIELSTKRAKMQAYTKVPDYVNLMGLTGQMINLSLIPTSLFNGKLEFDSVEGMAFKVALELRNKYPDTVGTISIGITNEQIQMLLDSMDIDYVIPYHHSAMSKVVRREMHIPTWESYQEYQSEKSITSQKDALANAKKYGVTLLNSSDKNYHKAPSFSEWFDLEEARQIAQMENHTPSDPKAQKKYGVMYGGYKAMQNAANNYLKLCAQRGLVPKFCHSKADFTVEDNYWKLLIDRKMINQKTGEIIEQKPVQPIFDEGEVLGILNNEIARYEDVKKDFDYATRVVTEKFLNGEMDEDISKIAKSIGDTVTNVTKVAILGTDVQDDTQFQDRDSTGRELSPGQIEFFKDSKVRDENGNLLMVYHGTDAEFTVFDKTKGRSTMDIQGMFFSPWELDAKGYGQNVKAYYLNITNPASEGVAYKALNKFKGQNNAGIKAREYLESLGYDGVNNGDEEYIAFNSNQIKFVDNLNPTENEDIRYQERYSPIDLTQDNELSKLIGDKMGSEKYNTIRDYIWELLGNENIVFSDGTSAMVDKSDALHIANKAYDQKTAEISVIKKLISSAVLFAEEYTEHKKFNYFKYYAVNVIYGNDEFPVYLNVGRGKNDGLFHLYDITKKIRDTANRINGFEGLREFPSINSISKDSISNITETVNTNFQDRPYQPFLEDLGLGYKKENEKLKSDVDRLREMLKLQGTVTHGKALARASYEGVAKKLLHSFGMKRVTDTELLNAFVKKLDSFYNSIINADADGLMWETIFDDAQEIARWLESKLPEKVDYKNPNAVEILRDIREKGIRLSEPQKAEAAYYAGSLGAYRKMNIGNFRIVNEGGISLTDLWEQIVSDYPGAINQELLERGEVAENLPSVIVEVIDIMRQTENLLDEDGRIQNIRNMATEIYDSYWQIPTVRTLADKHQQKVNLLKGKHRAEMDALREKSDSKLKDTKGYYQDMVKRVRADKDAKMEAYREHVAEQKHKNVEGRNKTATKNKIKKVVKALESLYNNPTKERNVKIEFQDMVKKALIMADAIFDDGNISSSDILSGEITIDLTDGERKLIAEWNKAYKARQGYQNRLEQMESSGGKDINPNTHEELLKMISTCNNKLNKLGRELSGVVERQKGNLNKNVVKAAIESLAKAYRSLNESSEGYANAAYNEYVDKRLTALVDALEGVTVKSMSLTQLDELYQAYKMVLTTVRTANDIFVKNKRVSVIDMGEGVINEIKKVAKITPDKVANIRGLRHYAWNELKPIFAFERIGSKTFMELFHEVMKGESVYARDIEEAKGFFQSKSKAHGYGSWDFDATTDFKLADGRVFSISLDEIMAIYAYSKREQALDHITSGGFVFDNKKFFTKSTEKGIKGKVVQYERTTAEAYRISYDVFNKIVNSLTQEQKKFVDDMQGYLSSMGNKGNEVSRVLYGIDIFNEKHYFPLMSSRDFIAQNSTPAGEVALKNSGMTKATVPHAKNPIVLKGFMDVWNAHVDKMSTYHAMVLPIENINKVFNYTGYAHQDISVSVKSILNGAYGSSSTDYISTFLQDLNGGVKVQSSGGLASKLMSNFKKTAVAASMSVAIQQPFAVIRAMAEINPKYFAGKSDLKHNETWEELKRYAPVAIIKEMGGFDIGSGQQTADYITAKEYDGIKEKAKGFFKDSNYRDEALMWTASKADEIGWNTIWNAVKREIADITTLKEGSEDFLQACGDRFTEVIAYTQVYDSVVSRSGWMRNKGEIAKMATAFMGEPTTSINMLYNAILQAKRGTISKQKATAIIGATVASIVLSAVAKSFIAALRDDDEDESYAEKYGQALGSNLSSDLNPLNMLPFVRDVMSLFEGWDVERTDMAVVKDIKDAFDGLDSDTKSTYRKTEDLLGAIAALFGIPLKNVMRTAREGYNFIANFFDENTYEFGDVASGVGEGVFGESGTSEINKALKWGNTDKANELIEEVVTDKVNGGMTEKEAEASVRSSITSYWKERYVQAYKRNDADEMRKIRKLLDSTGLYDDVLETCSDWIKSIKTDKDSAFKKW